MKLLLLLSLCGASAAVTVPSMSCKVMSDAGVQPDLGKSCNQLRQEPAYACLDGNTNVDIQFTYLGICDGGVVNGTESRLKLTGPAIKNVYQSAPKYVNWEDMTYANAALPNCEKRTLNITVDKCADHFNAQLFAETSNGGAFVFDRYMKRNCDLKTSISCQDPDGEACDVLDECKSGDFTYTFCYETGYSDHDITIRTYYNPNDPSKPASCVPPFTGTIDCQETHAYVGGFLGIGDFIGGGFPQQSTIGHSGNKKVCQTFTETISADDPKCSKGDLRKAYINVVGSVTAKFNSGAPISEFKNCFDSTKWNYDDDGNPPDGNPPDEKPCEEDPAPAPAPAPSSGKGCKKKGKGSGLAPSKGSRNRIRSRRY